MSGKADFPGRCEWQSPGEEITGLRLRIRELEAALRAIADFGHSEACIAESKARGNDDGASPVYECGCYAKSQWDIAREALGEQR